MANGISMIKSNVDEYLKQVDAAKARGLEAVGLTAERYAKANLSEPKMHKHPNKKGDLIHPNVDTGRLRNSISHEVHGDSVYIGTNVEYAVYVEKGTRKMQAYPYLKPAAQDHADEYKQILLQYLQNS